MPTTRTHQASCRGNPLHTALISVPFLQQHAPFSPPEPRMCSSGASRRGLCGPFCYGGDNCRGCAGRWGWPLASCLSVFASFGGCQPTGGQGQVPGQLAMGPLGPEAGGSPLVDRGAPGTDRLERGLQNGTCQHQCPCGRMSSPVGGPSSLLPPQEALKMNRWA